MNAQPEKILALQFKYFGDAVLMTPALRALREHRPHAEIHLLVPEPMAPLFEHLPWLDRVWAMPRKRGQAGIGKTWPMILALRRERFNRSVDFASNDRGAILSFVIGAKERLGWEESGGFLGRRYCFTRRVVAETKPQHESVRLAHLLTGWQVPPPASWETEIRADTSLAEAAQKILPEERAIICHVASSQPKKEWPLANWAKLHRLAGAADLRIVFTTAQGEREVALMRGLKQLLPDATILPQLPELPLFLAVLNRAKCFISDDTGPLHFAAGLGVPTIALFGPSSPERWAPIGARHQFLTGTQCGCDGHSAICVGANHCLAAITPEQVLERVKKILVV